MANPDETRVLLDVMCGELTSPLRMIGYDTVYALDQDLEADDDLRRYAEAEERVVITRDVDLASECEDSILLHSTDTDEQLAELDAAGFELALTEPRRCSVCNGSLVRVGPPGKSSPVASSSRPSGQGDRAHSRDTSLDDESPAVERIESTPESVPDPGETRLWRCRGCGHYFWIGSHWEDLEERLAKV